MPTAPFLAPTRDDRFAVGRAKGGGTTYYGVPGATLSNTASTVGPTLNTDYYWPWFNATPVVIDQLACEVVTGTAGNVRIGFYPADKDWQPGRAPLADSGNIDTSSTGVKTYTPGTPVYVPRGRYVSIMNASATGALFRSFGFSPAMIVSAIGSNPYVQWFSVARAYAAFPTPGTAWDTTAGTTIPGRMMILYRVLTP